MRKKYYTLSMVIVLSFFKLCAIEVEIDPVQSGKTVQKKRSNLHRVEKLTSMAFAGSIAYAFCAACVLKIYDQEIKESLVIIAIACSAVFASACVNSLGLMMEKDKHVEKTLRLLVSLSLLGVIEAYRKSRISNSDDVLLGVGSIFLVKSLYDVYDVYRYGF